MIRVFWFFLCFFIGPLLQVFTPEKLSDEEQTEEDWKLNELVKCAEKSVYFIHNYVQIYDATSRKWIPFHVWRAQFQTLEILEQEQFVIILKARQLGLTWLCLGFILWLMLFKPAATILLFSRREDEAKELLKRLKGMYAHLPTWLQAENVVIENTSNWELSNGSKAYAFPTTAGDSYTGTCLFCDEFDLVENQDDLITAVKPTVDAGGQMILLSRSNKKDPTSPFKTIYRAAVKGENDWFPIFLPWWARPGRSQQWYEDVRKDAIVRTHSTDAIYEQYPATPAEALAPSSLDKRIPGDWLQQCYEEKSPVNLLIARRLPAVPIDYLTIWDLPMSGHQYVIGADPAEGNPTSDDSAAMVFDRVTGIQVAELVGKIQPEDFGKHLVYLSRFYYLAGVMIERNNHGHAVIAEFRRPENKAGKGTCLLGPDKKFGWLSNRPSKALLYDEAVDTFQVGDIRIRSFETFMQLASIEGGTLKAPEGLHDDRAVAAVLGIAARSRYRPFARGKSSKIRELPGGMRIPA